MKIRATTTLLAENKSGEKKKKFLNYFQCKVRQLSRNHHYFQAALVNLTLEWVMYFHILYFLKKRQYSLQVTTYELDRARTIKKSSFERSKKVDSARHKCLTTGYGYHNCSTVPAPLFFASVAEDPLPPACGASHQDSKICSCSSSVGNSLFLRSSWFLYIAIKNRISQRMITLQQHIRLWSISVEPLHALPAAASLSPNFQ